MIGWAVCGIMTAADVIPFNKNDTRFYTRTDARSYIIGTSSWFFFPYPGTHVSIHNDDFEYLNGTGL
jgi:hypothetical protein